MLLRFFFFHEGGKEMVGWMDVSMSLLIIGGCKGTLTFHEIPRWHVDLKRSRDNVDTVRWAGRLCRYGVVKIARARVLHSRLSWVFEYSWISWLLLDTKRYMVAFFTCRSSPFRCSVASRHRAILDPKLVAWYTCKVPVPKSYNFLFVPHVLSRHLARFNESLCSASLAC